MTHITEHDTEQEGESHTGKYSRVNFLVHGNTISVNDFLEGPCELISFKVSRRLDSMVTKSLIVRSGIVLKNFPDLRLLFNGAPEEANVGGLTLLHLVEGMIESLFLGNEPLVDLESTNSFSYKTFISTDLIYSKKIVLKLSS
jgi:hypothetical protein